MRRSESCPDLWLYRKDSYIPSRKRAFSVGDQGDQDVGSLSMSTLNRIQSDSDLSRIDRKKTFEGVSALVQPAELLVRVVSALGNIRGPDEDNNSSILAMSRRGSMMQGVHGFNDSQILASERNGSGWSLPTSDRSYQHGKLRDRALSVAVPYTKSNNENQNEWTWSGSNTQIKDLMKLRQRQNRNDLYRQSFGTERYDNNQTTIPMPNELNVTSTVNNTLLNRLNPFRKRTPSQDSRSTDDYPPHLYLEATANGRSSNLPKPQSQRRASMFPAPPSSQTNQELLETTTIADLIRAIEMVHSTENPISLSNEALYRHRKMGRGSMSMTPPEAPPSLVTLFPHIPGESSPNINSRRRSSLKPNIYSSARYARRASAIPRIEHPPPYTETPGLIPENKSRFIVRPSNLLTPPGQTPPSSSLNLSVPPYAQSSALQRKLSLRPSPLIRLTAAQSSVRNIHPRAQQLRDAELGSTARRSRHGSLASLYEKKSSQSDRSTNDPK